MGEPDPPSATDTKHHKTNTTKQHHTCITRTTQNHYMLQYEHHKHQASIYCFRTNLGRIQDLKRKCMELKLYLPGSPGGSKRKKKKKDCGCCALLYRSPNFPLDLPDGVSKAPEFVFGLHEGTTLQICYANTHCTGFRTIVN